MPNPNAAFSTWIFNATTDLTTLSGSSAARIHLAGDVTLNQSWILRGSLDIDGEPRGSTPSFDYVIGSAIGGAAYPLLYAPVIQSVHFNKLKVSASGPQQSAFLSDQNTGTGGSVGIVSDDVAWTGANGNNIPVIIKSGFDFYFNRGIISNVAGGTAGFGVSPSLLSTINSPAVVGGQTNILAYRWGINGANMDHRGVAVDCSPNTGQNFFSRAYSFKNILFESPTGPFFRLNCFGGGNSSFSSLFFENIDNADYQVGFGTPTIDAQNMRNVFPSITNSGGGNGEPLIIVKDSTSYAFLHNPIVNNVGNIFYYGEQFSNSTIGIAAGQRFYSTFAGTPPAPNLVLSAGGSVPIGVMVYQVSCWDVENNQSLLGPSASVTTTSGNQTVTITVPTLPLGCVGWTVYRNGFRCNCTPGPEPPTFTAQDTQSFTHGDSSPSSNSAAVMIADNSRLAAPLLQHIDSSGFTVSTGVSTTLTANRTAKFPDATGTIAFKDAAQTWSANQTGVPLITPSIGGETISAAPRALFTAFLPGALTSTWTSATWTPDKAVTITRVQVQAKTAPSGCTTNAVVRLTDGTSPINVTISAAANDSGAITQNYAAAASLTVAVQTAASGCGTSPADANVVIQYRMQ